MAFLDEGIFVVGVDGVYPLVIGLMRLLVVRFARWLMAINSITQKVPSVWMLYFMMHFNCCTFLWKTCIVQFKLEITKQLFNLFHKIFTSKF